MSFGAGLIVVIAALSLAASAPATFPGANGLLAVQPAAGGGIVLVRADGTGARRICARHSACGTPRRPRWSADGRALVFTGPAIGIVGPDGSCMSCQFEDASNAAFEPRGTVVSSVQGGHVQEDGIDGIRQARPALGAASDAVWSNQGVVAIVRSGAIWVGSRNRVRRVANATQPSWSPTGRAIAAVRDGWVVTIRLRDGHVRRVVRGTAPAFSPDGRLLAYLARNRQVMIAAATGGPRPRPIGRFRLRAISVDWQPRPHTAIPGCAPPPGSIVLARSPDAAVTSDAVAHQSPAAPGLPPIAVMGCLRADGRERLLERFDNNTIDGAYRVSAATLAAPYAGLTLAWADDHYGGQTYSLQVVDLRTGRLTKLGGQSVSCPDYSGGCLSGLIDHVALGRDGVSGVHTETVDPIGTFATPLLHVSCAPSSTVCVALDGLGHVWSSSDPAAGSAAWSRNSVPGGAIGGPSAVACPSVSLCVGVSTHIYTSTTPGASPANWTQADLPQTGLSAGAVSCPSSTLCVVQAFDGGIVTSSNPTGGTGAWSAARLDITSGSGGYGAVFCTAIPQCFLTVPPSTVFTSTNPTGGSAAWPRSNRTPAFTSGTCPTTTLCVAINRNDIFATTDPRAETWTHASVLDVLTGVSCPSASLCLAVGSGGALEVSTDPASRTWTRATIDQGQTLTSIACPSASLCVASDAVGHVVTSTDPTAGPSSWHPALIDGDPCTDTTPCSEEQIQISDRSGVHTIDTSRLPGSGPFLTDLTLTGDTLSWSHSGAPRDITLRP